MRGSRTATPTPCRLSAEQTEQPAATANATAATVLLLRTLDLAAAMLFRLGTLVTAASVMFRFGAFVAAADRLTAAAVVLGTLAAAVVLVLVVLMTTAVTLTHNFILRILNLCASSCGNFGRSLIESFLCIVQCMCRAGKAFRNRRFFPEKKYRFLLDFLLVLFYTINSNKNHYYL